jgi:leucyl aminopeptidase
LSFAAQFRPDVVIDIATLTGGTTHIAGNMAGILCTNDESAVSMLKEACREAGEKFVHLEVLDEALEDLKSDVADLTNMHNRWSSGAPTMYAAAFLKQFVPDNTLWIHLDIANMAWSARPSPYLRNRGATSFGARAMVNIVKTICG